MEQERSGFMSYFSSVACVLCELGTPPFSAARWQGGIGVEGPSGWIFRPAPFHNSTQALTGDVMTLLQASHQFNLVEYTIEISLY